MTNKKDKEEIKLATEQKTPSIANVLLGTSLYSGYKLEFEIQQTVYLKSDKEQRPRLVTGIQLRPFNSITYGITEGTNETWHYGFEITDERDIIMARTANLSKNKLMTEVFRKVNVKDGEPSKEFTYSTNLGDLYYNKSTMYFKNNKGERQCPIWWLEEVPSPQMPSEEEMNKESDKQYPYRNDADNSHFYHEGFEDCYYWLRSQLG